MTACWTIEPLHLSEALVPGPEVLFQSDFDRRIEIAIFAFLLTNDEGFCVLVDTGLPLGYASLNARVRQRKGEWSGFRDSGERLARRLAARRLRPDAIVLTSFGPYATGGLPEIDAPRRFVSARGIADLGKAEIAIFNHPVSEQIANALRAHTDSVAGKTEPYPGLSIHEVGIHHPASMAVVVETREGRIAIADPVFHAENLTRGLPLGVAEYPAHWVEMVSDLAGKVDAVLPIHDPSAIAVGVAAIDPRLLTPVDIQQERAEW